MIFIDQKLRPHSPSPRRQRASPTLHGTYQARPRSRRDFRPRPPWRNGVHGCNAELHLTCLVLCTSRPRSFCLLISRSSLILILILFLFLPVIQTCIHAPNTNEFPCVIRARIPWVFFLSFFPFIDPVYLHSKLSGFSRSPLFRTCWLFFHD